MHKYLKQVLTQYLEGAPGQQVADKQGFNDLLTELIRLNLQQSNGNAGLQPQGPGGRMRSGKDRALSEKTAQQNMAATQPFGADANMAHGQPKLQNAAQVGSSLQNKMPSSQTTAIGKKVKVQKPTINLSINNNVQNVIVTPMGASPGQYAASTGSQQHLQVPSAQMQNPNLVNPNATPHQPMVQSKKRTSSEDNVNVPQNGNYMRPSTTAHQQR